MIAGERRGGTGEERAEEEEEDEAMEIRLGLGERCCSITSEREVIKCWGLYSQETIRGVKKFHTGTLSPSLLTIQLHLSFLALISVNLNIYIYIYYCLYFWLL